MGTVGRKVNPLESVHGLTSGQVRAWLEESCGGQGLAVLVSDPGVLSRVGVLLSGVRRKASSPGARRSQPPRDSHPVDIEAIPSRTF